MLTYEHYLSLIRLNVKTVLSPVLRVLISVDSGTKIFDNEISKGKFRWILAILYIYLDVMQPCLRLMYIFVLL